MTTTDQNELVSIIIPVFNAEAFLADTIQTVQNQTYSNWELIFVNDGSKDRSVEIIKRYQKKDHRIQLLSMKVNKGAALSRNKGIEAAIGRYIAFLDADDLWANNKLAVQIDFMSSNNCAFSFTGYEFADSSGKPNGKKVKVPSLLSYKQALKNTIISTITVMFDTKKIDKDSLYMPNIPSEDTATWWKILKKIDYAYGLNRTLSYYRRSPATLSSNKLVAVKRVWNLYRNVEKLNILYSGYNFCGYAFNTVRKRL